jgi:hypothetical protein
MLKVAHIDPDAAVVVRLNARFLLAVSIDVSAVAHRGRHDPECDIAIAPD